eukprot:3163-Heterococcus_DN1.PRE.2
MRRVSAAQYSNHKSECGRDAVAYTAHTELEQATTVQHSMIGCSCYRALNASTERAHMCAYDQHTVYAAFALQQLHSNAGSSAATTVCIQTRPNNPSMIAAALDEHEQVH